jgi:hypothetical protein
MPRLPIIHSRVESGSDGFRRETIDLEFSNGERRRYERLHSRGHGAVMIAAIPEPGTVLLIREYAAGVHRYELGLPKGRMDAGEAILDAANRELKEETGFGARKLTHLRGITLAPGYMTHEIQLVLAAFRPDGSLDTSFATGGLFHNLVLSGTNRPFGLAERAQNRDIVVGINILDDLFGDGHALQAAVQYDSSAHTQHAFAVKDFEGTPPASYGMDMVLDDNVIVTAGYRQWSSSSPRDVDTTIVRYIATDSIFADRFGGTLSD